MATDNLGRRTKALLGFQIVDHVAFELLKLL